METNTNKVGLAGEVVRDFRRSWKDLALTDIAYKIIGVVILVPLTGMLFRGFLALSGNTVLTDQDILYFLLGPVGWVCLIVMGAVWITIVSLEMAALMAIAWGAAEGQSIKTRTALYFAARSAWPTLKVTARIVGIGLLIAVPFLAFGGILFLLLLTEYDINYYLDKKPPAFWVAAGSIGSVLLVMVIVLIRVLLGYVFALPLLLFEEVAPRDTLRLSHERANGHRWTIVRWFLVWVVVSGLLLGAGSAIVGLIGQLILPLATTSLTMLAISTGLMLLFWTLVSFIITLVTTSFFALGLMHLYRTLGSPEEMKQIKLIPEEATKASRWLQLSRAKIVAGCIILVLLAGVIGASTLQTFRLEDSTTVTAHRGASADAPENSLAAVRQALEDKADWVEIDVQQSSDGVIIVCHDRDLKKLGGSDLVVAESTAEELQQVDIGSSSDPKLKKDERIPTLDEVLQLCKDKAGVNIELKYYGPSPGLEELVAERVEANDMQDQVVIMSLKHDAIAKMRKLRPKWKVGLLAAVSLGDLTASDADFLAVSTSLANTSFINRTHAAGKEVYVWTVNDAVTMSSMISRGVDTLITDHPARARRVLAERANMSPFERLLIELATFFGASPSVSLTDKDA